LPHIKNPVCVPGRIFIALSLRFLSHPIIVQADAALRAPRLAPASNQSSQ
jgi:hypothetical protein